MYAIHSPEGDHEGEAPSVSLCTSPESISIISIFGGISTPGIPNTTLLPSGDQLTYTTVSLTSRLMTPLLMSRRNMARVSLLVSSAVKATLDPSGERAVE